MKIRNLSEAFAWVLLIWIGNVVITTNLGIPYIELLEALGMLSGVNILQFTMLATTFIVINMTIGFIFILTWFRINRFSIDAEILRVHLSQDDIDRHLSFYASMIQDCYETQSRILKDTKGEDSETLDDLAYSLAKDVDKNTNFWRLYDTAQRMDYDVREDFKDYLSES